VGGVMTQAFVDGDRKTTRVLVQLMKTASYRVRADAGSLRISLAPAATTEPMQRPAASPDAGSAEPSRAGAPVSVDNVRFEHQAPGDGVRIELGGTVQYSESSLGAGRSIVELKNVKLPAALQRTLDVGAFGGPIHAISTYKRTTDPTRVVIEIERSAD